MVELFIAMGDQKDELLGSDGRSDGGMGSQSCQATSEQRCSGGSEVTVLDLRCGLSPPRWWLQPRKWVSTSPESMDPEKRTEARVRHGASQLDGESLGSAAVPLCPELGELPAVGLLVLRPGGPQASRNSPQGELEEEQSEQEEYPEKQCHRSWRSGRVNCKEVKDTSSILRPRKYLLGLATQSSLVAVARALSGQCGVEVKDVDTQHGQHALGTRRRGRAVTGGA